jgi:cardiolipin synthase
MGIEERNSTWKFFYSTKDTWEAMLQDIAEAETSIDFEQYIFDDFREGQIGRRFVDAFKSASYRGVSARLFIDGAGSFAFQKSDVVDELTEAGVRVRLHRIVKQWLTHQPLSFFLRDHRKVLVIDNRIGYIGGVCVEGDQRDWRDTMVRFNGSKIPMYLKEAFEEMWESEMDGGEVKYVSSQENEMKVVSNSPKPSGRLIYWRLLSAVSRAEESVDITTPYFVPDRRFKRVLKEALNKGVRVRLLLPKECDSKFMDIIARSYFSYLLENGVEIYLYEADVIHAKSTVVDGKWATVGSLNIDRLSFWFNHELNMVSENESFNQELADSFERDISQAVQISQDTWRRRSIWKKISEVVVIIARPFA